jgi:hypothetical protein
MSFIIDGTNGLTFNNATTQASAGSVLQVVQGTYSGTMSTASSTWTTTNLTASITPKFSTSKILVCVQHNGCAKGGGIAYLGIQILRNSTALSLLGFSVANNGVTQSNYIGTVGGDYLDSPATTSSVTYSTQFKSSPSVSAVYIGVDNEVSSITLMEIAG